ncbi:MAG: ATP-binding cassette domain-containing protein, partial [Clostridiales bacterium]|nr:ATP-binding cassette domain-containing protein [Clostridiales bacterium]
NVRFTYFPFAVHDTKRLSQEVLQDVCPQAEDRQILRELSLLQVDAQALYRPFAELSNGEQTKMLLAALFLGDNNFLLIDEPTNHLDAAARTAVAQYLRKKKGFILVSHDRSFLDGCVDHILSINKTGIEIQSGNFSSWLANFEKRQTFESAQNDRLQKDIARLEESAKRTSLWAGKSEASKYGKADSGLKKDKGYVGHKAAKLMKSAKVTELHRQNAVEQKSALLQNTETCERLKMFPLPYHGSRLLSFENVAVCYGDRTICAPVSFALSQGERIALVGKNGCGKSSFLKLVAGEPIRYSGTFRLASGLILSYVPQTTDMLGGALSDFARAHNLDESLFKAILHK